MDNALEVWKTSAAESLQSQSRRRRLTNKTALVRCSCTRIKGHNQLVEIQHWTLYSTWRLASKFARFVSDWKHLEHYGCRCLCQPTAADTDGTRTSSAEILEINSFDHCAKSRCLTDWMQLSETKETLFRTNTEPAQCLEVTVSSLYCAVGCCNIIEYYDSCWAAICIIFLSDNFVDHTYETI